MTVCLAGALLGWTTAATAQTLQLQYGFEDTGTTTASGGALNVPLSLLNAGGTATDIHGAANSGVQGQGKSLDYTATTETTGPTLNGPIAQALNNATLGSLGVLSNFTATIWFKEQTVITNTGNIGPRLFIMGTNGVADQGAGPGVLGLWYQTTNTLYFRLNNSIVSTPFYYTPLPTNIWLFAAVTYDGSNDVRLYFGTEATPARLVATRSIGLTNVNFGTAGSIMLGNRSSNRQRGFDGWLDDFRFYTGDASGDFIENVRRTSTPVLVTNVYPDGLTLMQGTNTFGFNVSSANGINNSGIQVAVNGADVTSSLVISGGANSKTVTYTGLPVNSTLVNNSSWNAASIVMQVTDASGIVTSNKITYDTFSSTNFMVEAEDYDYAQDIFAGPGNQYIDNPRYAFEEASDTYFHRFGLYGVDYSDNATTPQSSSYRSGFDLAATEFSVSTGQNGGNSVGEALRQKVLDAWFLNTAIREVDLGFFDTATNWQNYTRTYPAGAFNVYGRIADRGGNLSASLSQVTSGQGTSTQTTSPLGTFTFGNTGGWQSYSWVPLRDANGNLARVNLAGGVSTLRLSAGTTGGGNHNFFMLTPANTNLPAISGVYPNGTNMFQPSPTFSFTASSPAGVTISANSITVALTKRTILATTTTNLTSTNGLTVTGSAANKSVSLVLATNASYTAVVSVIDANGSPAGTTVNFDTYDPAFVWEAEDYNYGSGQTVAEPQTNGYAGFASTADVDYHDNVATSQNANPVYRTSDPVGVEINGDAPPRLKYIGTGFVDYDVGWYDNGNWNNYTRALPAGDFNVFMRVANGSTGSGGVALARVTSDPTASGQTTVPLGTFTIPATGGWQTYTWVPLRDANGNLVKVTGGSTQTLRATATGGANANFYALFAANTNLPTISNVYPNGTNLFQATNRLAFAINSAFGVSTGSVTVALNGVTVSNLTFTGNANAWSVSYLGLAPNTPYTALINVTDVNGSSASATVSFSTFPANLFTWEAEDYDYGGGQYTSGVDAYAGLSAVVDVDFHDANTGGNLLYRPNGTATDLTADQGRTQFAGTNDYNIGFFGNNEWGNYPRQYPAGSYNVWGRCAAGGGDTTAFLSQVTSGWGTTTQVTNSLGTFNVANSGWASFTWVPLRDGNGNLVTVSFDGATNTLKLARGPTGPDVNVNFLMLVPAVGSVNLSIARSGNNANISFPTQSGFSYQVQYKTNLVDVNWLPLGSPVAGNGSVQTIPDPIGSQQRFYRLSIQ